MNALRGAARRSEELTVLSRIAAALNATVQLDEALSAALGQVAELMGLSTGWVWLLDEEGGEPYLAASRDLPPALADHPERMAGTCYCLEVYRTGALADAKNVDVIGCSRLAGLSLDQGTDGLGYHASIPLTAPGPRRLGVLNVASRDWRELSADDLRLLQTIGDLVSIAVERTRLFEGRAEAATLEERNRLAREFHDTIAQGLTGVILQLEGVDLAVEAGRDPAEVRDKLGHALAHARANLAAVRRSLLDLRATALEGRSLVAALRDLATQTGADHAFTVELDLPDAHRPLPIRTALGVYRIAQEALVNCARHAEARTAVLSLHVDDRHVSLRVDDDGRGFDRMAVARTSFGLIGLDERARSLGGRVDVDSAPGRGTRVHARLPHAEAAS